MAQCHERKLITKFTVEVGRYWCCDGRGSLLGQARTNSVVCWTGVPALLRPAFASALLCVGFLLRFVASLDICLRI